MFAKPEINDFLDQLHRRRDSAREELGRAIAALKSELTQRGLLRSGARVKRTLTVTTEVFDRNLELMFGDLRRFCHDTNLDRGELRQAAYGRMQEMLEMSRAVANGDELKALFPSKGGLAAMVDDELTRLEQHLRARQRQFDIGMEDVPPPEGTNVTNSVHVGTNIGNIQLAGHGANQHATFNAKAIAVALDTFDTEMAKVPMDSATRTNLDADIATLRAQLKKPSLSQVLLTETGRSIRGLVEGVAAGMMTPQALAAAAALTGALGL